MRDLKLSIIKVFIERKEKEKKIKQKKNRRKKRENFPSLVEKIYKRKVEWILFYIIFERATELSLDTSQESNQTFE